MFPPKPTTDPQTLLGNVWASLKRAAEGHWGDQATVDPSDNGDGFRATLRTASKIPNSDWLLAVKYIKRYARKSHWSVSELKRQRGYVEMRLVYAPPKPRPELDRATQKIA